MMQCCVCGNKEQNKLHVCNSYGAMSECYCEECLRIGKRCYANMVCYYACAGTKLENFNEGARKHAIRQLVLHDKTVEEFERDLAIMAVQME